MRYFHGTRTYVNEENTTFAFRERPARKVNARTHNNNTRYTSPLVPRDRVRDNTNARVHVRRRRTRRGVAVLSSRARNRHRHGRVSVRIVICRRADAAAARLPRLRRYRVRTNESR